MADKNTLTVLEARATKLLNDVFPVLEKIEVKREGMSAPNVEETFKLHNTVKEIRNILRVTNQRDPLKAELKNLPLPDYGD